MGFSRKVSASSNTAAILRNLLSRIGRGTDVNIWRLLSVSICRQLKILFMQYLFIYVWLWEKMWSSTDAVTIVVVKCWKTNYSEIWTNSIHLDLWCNDESWFWFQMNNALLLHLYVYANIIHMYRIICIFSPLPLPIPTYGLSFIIVRVLLDKACRRNVQSVIILE